MSGLATFRGGRVHDIASSLSLQHRAACVAPKQGWAESSQGCLPISHVGLMMSFLTIR